MTEQEIRASLLPEIKRFVRFDWEDAEREDRLVDHCLIGMATLDRILPAPTDYTTDAVGRGLLLNWIMYAESNSTDEFWNNYQSELIGWKMDKERAEYEETIAETTPAP